MNKNLSHSETARALRAFIFSSGMWGSWGQVVGIGTAVFTGYVLYLGATDAQVAYFVSIASLASIGQVISSVIAPHIKHKKRFVFVVGMCEMILRFAMILAPFFIEGTAAILFVGTMLGLALICGHTISPIYNDWLATIIPEDIRARFISRQTMANLLSGMAAAFAAGKYIDLFSDETRYAAFFTAFVLATILGVGGYINLMRVPFREHITDAPGNLLTPFRDPPFLKLLLFFLLWNFALGISSPFYSVFMLKTLHIDYATVAIFNSLFMGAMVIGYRILGGLVDKYGGKAILQLLAPPCILLPILWVFNRPDFYYLIPVVMVLSGLIHAGILVSVNAILFGILSEGRNKTTYFAAWSTTVNMTYAIAPLLGSALVAHFESIHLQWFHMPIGNLQISFLATSVVLIIPILFLPAISDKKQTSPGELINQVSRGNLLGYLYGALSFRLSWNDTNRARAVRKMGQSRSPMALDQLIQALSDANPEVRRQAAQGLGEAGAKQAIDSLLEELRDEESDIRTEAIEALGKIGDPGIIDHLIEALNDPDTRVQISAIRALSEMGNEEATELLFWKFADHFDRATFPTLADVLGAKRDLRMVRSTLDRIQNFRSPTIRLQLLNAICRALGARRRFYQLISQDNLARAESLEDMLHQTQRAFRRTPTLASHIKKRVEDLLKEIHKAFDTDQTENVFAHTQSLATYLEHNIDQQTVEALGPETAARLGVSVLTLNTYLSQPEQREEPVLRIVFCIVCLWCIADALTSE
ncbi:MAG: MFS family permease [Candidatus Latescibacterota bacterium]|jgi:MFS family permease